MDKTALGRLISELRKEKNLTQKDLGELLHVSDKTISKWERGQSFPDVTLFEELSGALGITVTELIACQRLPLDAADPADMSQIAMQNAVSMLREESDRFRSARRRQRLVFSVITLFVVALAASGFFVSRHITRLANDPFNEGNLRLQSFTQSENQPVVVTSIIPPSGARKLNLDLVVQTRSPDGADKVVTKPLTSVFASEDSDLDAEYYLALIDDRAQHAIFARFADTAQLNVSATSPPVAYETTGSFLGSGSLGLHQACPISEKLVLYQQRYGDPNPLPGITDFRTGSVPDPLPLSSYGLNVQRVVSVVASFE